MIDNPIRFDRIMYSTLLCFHPMVTSRYKTKTFNKSYDNIFS
jgi:hypothetical protein